MIKKKNPKKAVLDKSNYRIILQLYYLNKRKRIEARLPMNDLRKPLIKEIIKNESNISLRNAFLKIAALW